MSGVKTVRMTAADAQFYWMSQKVPNDSFVLYAFDGEADSGADKQVLERARGCPDLAMRVDDGCALTYPAWVHRDVGRDQIVTHDGSDDWQACLDAVARLADNQLDLREAAWRLHIFGGVRAVPGSAGPATVAVFQVGHALADGARQAAMAAVLFGRKPDVPQLQRFRRGPLFVRSVAASRAFRELKRDTAAGLVPPPAQLRPALSINRGLEGSQRLGTLMRRRDQLRGPTVTVAVLTAVSDALAGYLRAGGEDASALGAEVPTARSGVRHCNNHFGNVGVGLYPELPFDERVARISEELAMRRRRGDHRAFVTSSWATAAVPARVLRWGVGQFDAAARSPMVTGNTVVSSVNRGPADLTLGGRPVVLTAGYPALSPMMGLAHGVHGIGDTIAISVHAAQSAVADLDDYLDRLSAALG
jgi:WS/DGAT C-terminal domain